MKKTFLAALVVAFGLVAIGNVALAGDTITINGSTNEGLQGTSFVPSNFFGAGNPCVAAPGGFSMGSGAGVACFEMGDEALNAWFTGGYFEPRGGTEIIPPSGDHHRSGWRTMMVDHFSPGAFLTGFAPFLNQFPNFPQVGTPGPSGYDPDLLLLFLDHHGEPLTPGRFPRYIPHERQAWADTLMVKYVASGGGAIPFTLSNPNVREFSQSLRSQVGGFRGDGTPFNTVTWMSMSNESAEGCGGPPFCVWTFDVGSDGAAGTSDDELSRSVGGTVTVVTSSLRIASFFGAANGGTVDLLDVPLAPIEAVPTVVDDRLDQAIMRSGDTNIGLQALRYQIQIVSGPNFHGEEGSDPYTWVICGSRTGGAGEHDCDAGGGAGIIDETFDWALASGGTYGAGSVYSHADRFGADGRFFTADDGAGADGIKATADDTIVACTGGPAGTVFNGAGDPMWATDCDSDPGADDVYGTGDDEHIYYRMAIENGFLGGVRENRAMAFSFIDAQEDLRQILAQSIAENFLASCLNCNSTANEHPNIDVPGPLNYDQLFPPIPDLIGSTHPPSFTASFNVVP